MGWWVFVAVLFATACGGAIGDGDAGDGGVDANDDMTISDACTDACGCAVPLSQCATDDASTCVDLSAAVDNCGACGRTCSYADAGYLLPGTQNPDAGVSFGDAGYDAGTGWTLGSRTCVNGACGFECPSGLTECMPGICFDTTNFHGYCGSCSNSCKQNEWCTEAHCCPVGQIFCGTACTDPLWDSQNCGGCGVSCSTSTPTCANGVCAAAVTYHAAFDSSVPSAQCTAWDAFRAQLTGTYSSITLLGSNDPQGRTCTGANADTLCQALHNGTTVAGLACNSYVWNVDTCFSGTSIELSADNTVCYCSITNGYTVRPCIGNHNWGGIKSTACYAQDQTIAVVCQ